jgi:hypothetical protein
MWTDIAWKIDSDWYRTVMIVICIITEYFVTTRFLANGPRRVNSAHQTKPSVTFHENVSYGDALAWIF